MDYSKIKMVSMEEAAEMLRGCTIMTPQFERTPDMPIPADIVTFRDVPKLSRTALLEMGCAKWDEKGLLLFPGEWYDKIPDGFEFVDINYETEEFVTGVTCDDIRFGCLAYGVVRP